MDKQEIIELFKKQGYLDIEKITPVTMSEDDKNKIYKITTKESKYILKIIPEQQDLGEEDTFDVLYDCKVHEFVSKQIEQIKPRRCLKFGKHGDKNYIIQIYVEGELASENTNKTYVINQIWETMKYLQKKCCKVSSASTNKTRYV